MTFALDKRAASIRGRRYDTVGPFSCLALYLCGRGICRLAVFGLVKPHRLVAFRHAHLHHQRNELEYHKGPYRRKHNGQADADQLRAQQSAPEEQAFVGHRGVYGGSRKQPRRNTAPDTADAVAAERVQRIVVSELLLEYAHAKPAKRTYHKADDDGRPYRTTSPKPKPLPSS